MILAIDYITARYPGVNSSRVIALVPLAEAELAPDRFNTQYGHAVGLLVLHWITKEELAVNQSATANPGTITGVISSEKEGDLARSYTTSSATTNSTDKIGGEWADWDTTSWGRELIRLIKAVCFGVGIA